ncbi:caspase domain-containing protein [Mycena filopes]|nr:caspase domain-containing protein [Mycena filopes]
MSPSLAPVLTQFEASSSHGHPRREPKKKALLIGISGLSSPTTGYEVLQGPHRDVAEMKSLLTRSYGYRTEDIQVLVDDGVVGHLQPDRRNIMTSIANLVNDTHKGDKLFFHYCGHTIQVPSRSNSEEDGLDECLVPLDGEDQIITDNELRSCLVDTLPVGVSLVAVLDSCHSASLLDLEHLRCNRVFVPWKSSQPQSDDIRNRVRRLAIPTESPAWTPTSRTILQSARTSPTRIRSRRTSIDTVYTPLTPTRMKSPLSPLSSRNAPWIQTNLNSPVVEMNLASEGNAPRRRISISRSPVVSRKSRVAPPALRLWEANNKENRLAQPQPQPSPTRTPMSPQSAVWLNTPTPLWCDSPEGAFCQGWCRAGGYTSPMEAEEVADVISLASCKDSELSWENETGVSMTQALVAVLNEEPHPPLRELVTKISHELHEWSLSRHQRAKAYNTGWKRYLARHGSFKSPRPKRLDTGTFQHPQIASRRPLNMDREWDL